MADYIYTLETRLSPDQQKAVTLVLDAAKAAGMKMSTHAAAQSAAARPLIASRRRGAMERRGAAVQVVKDASVQVRYTLDGCDPDASSPLYGAPIVLSKTGLVELRLAPLTADGAVSKQVFAKLYSVE